MELDKHDDSWKVIWRNAKNALPEDKWKWDDETWRDTQEKIWNGDIGNLVCPICECRTVYFKYLVFSQHEAKGEGKLLADRWIGCSCCNVQVRDTSITPKWLENPEWSPRAAELRQSINPNT